MTATGALERARELSCAWDEALRLELPADADVFDAHTHLGDDIDGMYGRREELLGLMDRYGVSQAFFFCMDEPDRHPAFRAANDRTLADAARAPDRLIPFVRLDLTETPLDEAVRCLDLGARGVKLHPRAQRFLPDDPRLDPVFALAAERRVPILIHGGRGLPPIAAGLARMVERHEGTRLIVAHAGIADMSALTHAFRGHANVVFDTSVWSAVDLLDFMGQVAPGQVVYASDYPYGQQPGSLLVALRTARRSGWDEDEIRAMLAGTASRIAGGEPPAPLGPVKGLRSLDQPLPLGRIHGYLTMATALFWSRQADTFGILGLAANACDELDRAPESDLHRIQELVVTVQDLWRHVPAIEDPVDRLQTSRFAYKLLHLADILAVTTGP